MTQRSVHHPADPQPPGADGARPRGGPGRRLRSPGRPGRQHPPPMPPAGCGSRLGPRPATTQLCPPPHSPWPSTWATWRPPAAPLLPSSWPAPPSPIPRRRRHAEGRQPRPPPGGGRGPSGAGITGPPAPKLTEQATIRGGPKTARPCNTPQWA